MRVLGIDFETTGLSAKSDRVIEIGFAVWDIVRKVPLKMGSHLILHDKSENIVVSPAISKITGILPKDLEEYGVSPQIAFDALIDSFKECTYVVAHNGGQFDKPFFESETARLNLDKTLLQIPWIDTMYDVPYPEEIQIRKLTYLAAEHGILNPFPHRAVFDVLTMMRVMSCYPFDDIITLQKSPMVCLHAVVSYDNNKLAKERGYRWDPESKRWLKWIKEMHVQAEMEKALFKINKTQ